jgi:hypothetical protein
MWIKLMNKSGVVAFLAMGLVITIVFELLATGPLKRMILKHVILIFRTGLNFKGNRLSGSMSTVAPFLSIPRIVKKYQSNGIMFTVKNDSPCDNATFTYKTESPLPYSLSLAGVPSF